MQINPNRTDLGLNRNEMADKSRAQNHESTSRHMLIPDFGGELYSGLDDEGFLWMCGHAWLLLHHK